MLHPVFHTSRASRAVEIRDDREHGGREITYTKIIREYMHVLPWKGWAINGQPAQQVSRICPAVVCTSTHLGSETRVPSTTSTARCTSSWALSSHRAWSWMRWKSQRSGMSIAMRMWGRASITRSFRRSWLSYCARPAECAEARCLTYCMYCFGRRWMASKSGIIWLVLLSEDCLHVRVHVETAP